MGVIQAPKSKLGNHFVEILLSEVLHLNYVVQDLVLPVQRLITQRLESGLVIVLNRAPILVVNVAIVTDVSTHLFQILDHSLSQKVQIVVRGESWVENPEVGKRKGCVHNQTC